MGFPSFTKVFHHAPYDAIDPSLPELSAADRTVLIAGAGSGIGQATAIAFAQAGAKVIILTGRRVQELEDTKRKIESAGLKSELLVRALDVTLESEVEQVFDEALSRYGPTDICVFAAGHLSLRGKLSESTVSNYWDSFEVNVKGAFLVNHAFLNQSAEDDRDRVLIFINTALAHLVPSQTLGPASYPISKLAQAKLVEHSAAENKDRKRFKTYAVHPGIVPTRLSDLTMDMCPPGTRDYIDWDVAELPARFFVWLASPKASFIPSGKFLWANWDVNEMYERKDEFQKEIVLTQTLHGWPFEHMS